MITAQEAWEATNPAHPEEKRIESARSIMAAIAANDVYLTSRSEIEQAIALAKGQAPPPHEKATAASNQMTENAAKALGAAVENAAGAAAGPVGAEVAKAAETVVGTAVEEIDPKLADEIKSEIGSVAATLDALAKRVGL